MLVAAPFAVKPCVRPAKRDFGGVEGDVLRKRRQREAGNGQREEGLCGSFHDVDLPHGSLNESDFAPSLQVLQQERTQFSKGLLRLRRFGEHVFPVGDAFINVEVCDHAGNAHPPVHADRVAQE